MSGSGAEAEAEAVPGSGAMPASTSAPEPAGSRLLLVVLALGAFTTALNVTLLSPLLTRIAAEFGVGEPAAGQLATVTAAAAGVFALLAAPVMDRYPRRTWLRVECALLAAGSLASALAPGFGPLFAARVVAGVGGAVIGANCLAAVGDLYADPDRRNRGLGLINTAFTLGAVLGLPVLTQIADAAGWRWAILAPAPLAAVVFVGTRWLPGAPPDAPSAAAPDARGAFWCGWATGYRRVLANAETVWLLAALLALMMVWFGWLIFLGAYAETVLAVGATTLSLLYLAGGGAEVVGNNLAPLALRTRSPRALASAAAAVLTACLLLSGVGGGVWALFPYAAVFSAAGAVLFLCLSIALLDSLPVARGAVMSLQSAVLELGGAFGVAMTGVVLAALGDYPATYRLLALLVPLVAAALLVSGRRRTGALPAPAPAASDPGA